MQSKPVQAEPGEICLLSKPLPLSTLSLHPLKILAPLERLPSLSFKGLHAVCTPSGTSPWHTSLTDTHGIIQCFPNSSMYVPYSCCFLCLHTICLIYFFKSTYSFFLFLLKCFQKPHNNSQQKTSLFHIHCFPSGSTVKRSTRNAGDPGSIPVLGRSPGGGKATHSSGLPLWLSWERICLQCRRPWFDPWVGKIPWRRKGYPLQYSGLEISMDRIFHGVVKSWTQLSDFHFHFNTH